MIGNGNVLETIGNFILRLFYKWKMDFPKISKSFQKISIPVHFYYQHTVVDGISELGRNTQGVRLITLADGEDLISLGLVVDSTGTEPEIET